MTTFRHFSLLLLTLAMIWVSTPADARESHKAQGHAKTKVTCKEDCFEKLIDPCIDKKKDEYAGKGDYCRIALKDLHTTQFSIGLKSVMCKATKLKAKGATKLTSYLLRHPLPMVKKEKDTYYFTDHHHMSAALYMATGDSKQNVYAVVNGQVTETDIKRREEDLNTTNKDRAFWNIMNQHNWLYPYGEDGQGPLDPEKLPSVENLHKHDNAYRSLSWMVRQCGGYQKMGVDFEEFKWAAYLRYKLGMSNDEVNKAIDYKTIDPATYDFHKNPKPKKDPHYQAQCMGSLDGGEKDFCAMPLVKKAMEIVENSPL